MTISKDEYLICPCKVSSIPYWKAKSITVPDGMSIVHQDNFNKLEYRHYIDEPFFRLIHSLQDLSVQVLPQGYSLCKATLKDFTEHINSCYSKTGVMGYLPEPGKSINKFITISRDEYENFVENTIQLVAQHFAEKNLWNNP